MAGEKVTQARAGFLPSLSANATYLRQDTGPYGNSAASGSALSPGQTNARLTLTQSLFRGFRDQSAVLGAAANHHASRKNLEQTRLQLYAAVAGALSVLAAERDRRKLWLTAA